MSYAPFPEAELRRLADEYEQTSKCVGPKMREFYEAKAAMLRNAIAQHEGLRARFLEQSMRVRELEAREAKVA